MKMCSPRVSGIPFRKLLVICFVAAFGLASCQAEKKADEKSSEDGISESRKKKKDKDECPESKYRDHLEFVTQEYRLERADSDDECPLDWRLSRFELEGDLNARMYKDRDYLGFIKHDIHDYKVWGGKHVGFTNDGRCYRKGLIQAHRDVRDTRFKIRRDVLLGKDLRRLLKHNKRTLGGLSCAVRLASEQFNYSKDLGNDKVKFKPALPSSVNIAAGEDRLKDEIGRNSRRLPPFIFQKTIEGVKAKNKDTGESDRGDVTLRYNSLLKVFTIIYDFDKADELQLPAAVAFFIDWDAENLKAIKMIRPNRFEIITPSYFEDEASGNNSPANFTLPEELVED